MTLLLYGIFIFFIIIAIVMFITYFLLINRKKATKLLSISILFLGIINLCLGVFVLFLTEMEINEIVRLDGEVVSLEGDVSTKDPIVHSVSIHVGFIDNVGEKWLTSWLMRKDHPRYINVNDSIYSYFTENEDEKISNYSRDESIQNIYLCVQNYFNPENKVRIKRHIEVLFNLSNKKVSTNKQLNYGDIITNIDGKKFNTVDEIDDYLLTNNPQKITVEFLRNNQKQHITIKLNTEFKGIPSLGFWPVDRKEFTIDQSLPNILLKDGGDSAGLAIASQIILDKQKIKLQEKDIVITGAIDEFGNVKKIGGIENKVTTILKGDYRYFIVPKENYDSAMNELAKRGEDQLEIISVSTLEETIEILKSLKK